MLSGRRGLRFVANFVSCIWVVEANGRMKSWRIFVLTGLFAVSVKVKDHVSGCFGTSKWIGRLPLFWFA